MEDRITYKVIEIDNRKFRINKFDPLFGAYIASKFLVNRLDKFNPDKIVENLLQSNNFEEFEAFQKRVLSYCEEILPNTKAKVINSEGNIGIINLTAPMVMSLFIQTIMFSFEDFFEEGVEVPQMENQEKIND